MNQKPRKLIWLAAILLMLVWFSPLLVQASTVCPAPAVNLEVGIQGNTTISSGITDYIQKIYFFATAIVGGLAVVMIIIGAVQYSTSAGNKAAMGSAKETITSAIIGLVIVLMAYLILGTFSGSFVNLANPCLEVVPVPTTTLPPEQHLVCGGGSRGAPTCGYATGGTADDPKCAGGLGSSCASTSADCATKHETECNMDANCSWCKMAGSSECVARNACDDRKKASCNAASTCEPSSACGTNPSSPECQAEQNQAKGAGERCEVCPAVILKDGGPTGKLICCSWP